MSTIVAIRDRIETLLEGLTPLVNPATAYTRFSWQGAIDDTKHERPREFEVRPSNVLGFGGGAEGCDSAVIQEIEIFVFYPYSAGAVAAELNSWRSMIAMAASDSAEILKLLNEPPIHWGSIAHDVRATQSTLPDQDIRFLRILVEAHYTLG